MPSLDDILHLTAWQCGMARMVRMAVMEVKVAIEASAVSAAIATVLGVIDTHSSSNSEMHRLESFWICTESCLPGDWVNISIWLKWYHELVNLLPAKIRC